MKITLKNVELINWYGFSKVIIPYDDNSTLLTGENESGKSTILDAVRYAYIGDTVFNRSSGSSKRTIKSYTRCLTDPSSNKYARPAETHPVVYTHIGLEFEDTLNNRVFTLVTTIETAANDDTTPSRYIINKPLQEIEFTETKDGIERVHTAKEMAEFYRVPTYNTSDGIKVFMREIGLNLSDESINDYRLKLRNMMTYKAETRISTFMKQSVLEPKPVDLEKLKTAKTNIDNINDDLQRIKNEQDKLNAVLDAYNEYNRVDYNITLNSLKEYFSEKRNHENEIDKVKSELDKVNIELKDIKDNKKPVADDNLSKALNALTEAKSNLLNSEGAQALERKKAEKEELCQERDSYKTQAEELSRFQELITSILNKNYVKTDENTVLKNITEGEFSETEKKYAVEKLKDTLESNRDEVIGEQRLIQARMEEIDKRNSEIRDSITVLEKNRVDHNAHAKQNELIDLIKEELNKNNNPAEVKMAFEYVIEIESEWQDAVETFMGPHRFAILVEPEGFDIANKVFDRYKSKGVELVRTKALAGKEWEVYTDSVVNKLNINNPIAKQYFDFWLGRIHAVENNRVHEFDSAMSSEGKLSRNMAVSYLNIEALREYVLGIGAAEKTIAKLLHEKETNEDKLNELNLERNIKNTLAGEIREYLRAFKSYNYSAYSSLKVTQELIESVNNEIEDLEKSLENDNTWFTLNQIVSSCQINYDECKKDRDNLAERSSKLNNDKVNCSNLIAQHKQKIEELDSSVTNIQIEHPKQFDKAYIECKQMTDNEIQDGIWIHDTKTRNERRFRELIGIIQAAQITYNNLKKQEERLDTGVEYENQYRNRLEKITMDDFDTVQRKMKQQTAEYERTFKSDFCNTIYVHTKSSINDIRKINSELRKLKFQTEYRIEIKQLDDSSDYSKIIKYAKYNEQSLDLFSSSINISQEEADQLENDIREIINRITSPEGEAYINDYADYRNYLSYAVKINNASTVEGDLASQIGYDSGAATQIPYILILAAALSMYYNARSNSARLIFIDEPFEKMSPSNIEQMLQFFRKQDFQTILCAPIDKMGSIGDDCGVTDYIVKIKKEQMVVGKVVYKDIRSQEVDAYE